MALTSCVVGEDADDRSHAPEQTFQLGGRTIDYFTNTPVAEIALETIGLAPERSAASDLAGDYALEVPVESSFFVRTSATENHRPTVSDVARSETADIPVFSSADVSRQHVSAGVAVVPDTTMVFVELASVDGMVIADVARASLSIIDPTSLRVIAPAPLVVGPAGDVDPALESASGAVVRFVFLNVEPGEYVLVVGETEHPLISSAGVTLRHVTLTGPPGPPPDAFASVYPLFQHGADGGLGCANCHTAGGAIPTLDGPVDQVREALVGGALVDLADPDRSPLLVRPLYESPADHPNATFLSSSDPDYQAIRAWIAAGAK